ncbi:SusD/RagB family nutrient-binding outer membrane lipoprotein [Rhizosphaericola mali]|uniref:SusD/RagB family nutrient-binding outer membrane lipoprotein n=1 Tax=Rhizosphaericola mali TaxID=2545455 RepID=A0A5P2G8X1_9BACT|nr:SusD/RagB family nutrient-binding outer membrane lipoprotein [Rhizosphaericola mali]QES90382.1 SusD/RagB family nutrient-binding outer membrane lipoprotein [Rhizosphaericola mali]
MNIHKSLLLFSTVIGLLFTSCNKYLDVNKNPNTSTSSTPQLVLPQAIVYSGAVLNTLNTYGLQIGGYAANAGGYGGFGVNWTYDFGQINYTGIWSSSYDVLEDIQYVINVAATRPEIYPYYSAAAKILKVYNYEHLVDQYNNIPYTEALTSANLTPKYDNATDIYPKLANILDSAILDINSATSSAITLTSGTDPLFGGDMTSWIKFANTLKLKLIVKGSATVSFANTTFTSEGFLTDDAIENPGYAQANGQTNPFWSTWVVSYTGVAATRSWIPSRYTYSFYNGNKISDTGRGKKIYYNFPSTPINQLGLSQDNSYAAPATAGAWYSGTGSGTSLGGAAGVMKGYNMGVALFTAAESYFLQAEAQLRGIISGTPQTSFEAGITASFKYIYMLPNESQQSGTDYSGDATKYITTNTSNYLVNFALATSDAQKLEAIITQKYIALNMVSSDEGWNEYRRTGYPFSSTTVVNNANNSFASTQSVSTRPDHLPTRLQYPASEYSANDANVPKDISSFTSLIFWAK